jgi:hypothetical protein
MKASYLAAALVLAGCASTGDKGRAAIQATDLPPCQIVADDETRSWRLVAGDGFTFCVPETWATRRGAWRGDGASLTWEPAGPPRSREIGYRVTTVRGEDLAKLQRQGHLPDGRFPLPRVFVEDVAGIPVEFSTHHRDGRHHVSAQWPHPSAIRFRGQSAHADGIVLLTDILRTVRLVD